MSDMKVKERIKEIGKEMKSIHKKTAIASIEHS
jgi:hypothetical protein